MRSVLPVLLFALLSGGGVWTTAGAPADSTPPLDSAQLHDQARDAQAAFERRHRMALPTSDVDEGGASCDEVVGRFCLTFGGGDDWVPEPDSPEILQARDDLLRVLNRVGEAIPGDRWVAGQRVYYLGEEGRWEEALEVVGSCGGARDVWWCHALRGYALHHSDRYEEALDEFRTALDEMDRDRRERWTDPGVILERGAGHVWGNAHGQDREHLRSVLWELADPLYLVPGNDRLTAHYSRRVNAWIRDGAKNPYGIPWGWDLTELVVRYGSEMGWEQERPSAMSLRPTPIIGHHHPDSRVYMPPGDVLSDPTGVRSGDWPLDASVPHTSYAPPYAPDLRDQPYQLGLFRRGGEMVAVAGYALPPDTGRAAARPEDSVFSGPPAEVRAGLFLLRPDSGEMLQVERTAPDSGGLSLRAPMGRYLASVEVWSRERARAGRERVGVSLSPLPPDVAALSDLLLLDHGPGLPKDLEAAVPRVRPTASACPGDTVAAGWEVYGVGLKRETMRFRLRLEPTHQGFLQQAGHLFGLGGGGAPVSLQWTEPGPEHLRPFFRAVDLTLPDDLHPGSYRLSLEVDLSGRSPLRADRSIQVPDASACAAPASP